MVPERIEKQLSDHGRVVAVIQDESGLGKGTIFKRAGGSLSGRPEFDAAVPLLPGFERSTEFVF